MKRLVLGLVLMVMATGLFVQPASAVNMCLTCKTICPPTQPCEAMCWYIFEQNFTGSELCWEEYRFGESVCHLYGSCVVIISI